ncbi:MAG: NAD(P)H-dependent oxidoreductase [Microbacterium sp.]
MALRVVAVSGSLRSGSTTAALLRGILDELAGRGEVDAELIELSPLARDLADVIGGEQASARLASALDAVGDADLLVVATPIYRGSYTGLFKQFFDVVHQDAIAGKPVLLAAGGGNDLHSLAIDHELRPLFAFFRAQVLPVGVYARAADFSDGSISADGLRAKIAAAVEASGSFLAVAASA